MAGGGKGGSQTTEMTVPDWVERPARRNLARAEEISQIGYVPYGGPEVAAFTGAQNAAFANNRNAAQAFGMNASGQTIPRPETFAGGVQGYSSLPLYNQAVDQLQADRPGQYDAIMAQFIDPRTGAGPSSLAAGAISETMAPEFQPDYGGPGDHGYGGPAPTGGAGLGGYSGFADMFDGGGPGASGGAFQGGGLASAAANAATGGGPGGRAK